ncbi:hypothetical protein L1049_009800 [Liquidambar formosana]|uniref:Malectin domain-containing protein n=1 Tax=Liquidambar formosana TaxID=63359 RepID=A0AAP0R3R0_LIQFO
MKVPAMEVMGLIFLVTISVFVRTGEAETKSFLINCGTNSSANVDGRKWVGDFAPDNNLTLSSVGIEAASTVAFSGDSIFASLYKTARIFTDSLNYTFRANQGNYFLRLHFHPFSFQNYNVNDSSFDVMANGLKLVSEFNVPGEISHKNSISQSSESNSSSLPLVKEYFLAIDLDVIVIEFNPTKGSFGFVNAIELVPVVNTLFVDTVSRVGGNGANSFLNVSKRGIRNHV